MKILFDLVVQDANIATKLDSLRSDLREIQKELKGVDDGSTAFKALSDEAALTRIEISKLTTEQKALKKEFAASQLPTDSLAALRLQYSGLVAELRLLTKAERESDSGQKLIKNAKSLKDEISKIEQSVGNFTGSVGSYKDSIISASESLGIFGSSFKEQAGILTAALGIYDSAVDKAGAFASAIKSGVVSIKDGIAGFADYFKKAEKVAEVNKEVADSTEAVGDAVEKTAEEGEAAGKGLEASAKGATLLSTASKVVKAALASIGIGLIISLVLGLVAVFKKFTPVIDFVEQAISGLSAAVEVLIARAARLVSAFLKLIDGDFSGAFDEAAGAVSGIGTAMVNAASAASGLTKEFQELQAAQSDFTLQNARTEVAVAKLNKQLTDSSKSASARIAIANQLTKLETENLKTKTSLIDKELDIERRKLLVSGQITEDQAKQIADGNFELSRQLRDEFKLQDDATDRILELLIEKAKAEGESVNLLELTSNRKNAIVKAAADKAKAAAEKENKALEAQIARIRELQASIRELDASTLTSDFDRQETDIENKRAAALDKVAKSREVLLKKIKDQGGVITANDLQETKLIDEQTSFIVAAFQKQIEEVRDARNQAIRDQEVELIQLLAQVQDLATKNAEAIARTQVDILNTDFSAAQGALLTTLKERRLALLEELESGTINQKKFNAELEADQQDFNLKSLELEKARAAKVKAVSEELAQAKIDAADAALRVQLSAIDAEFEAEVAGIRARAIAEGTDPSERIAAARLKFAEDRKAAEIEYVDAVKAATEEATSIQLEAADRVLDAEAKAHEAKLKNLKEEADKRRELQDAAIDAAATIAGAVFSIQKQNIEKEEAAKTEALDAEFEKKREAAAGNVDELAALDKQYAVKKEAIEKETAQKRKKQALTEAIIEGALAVVKALPNFILAALAGVAAAAQIAVISNQKFATGGIAKFGTFGGRSHSTGGTKGQFDDGTRVEVEKDEVFIILNKRASNKIAQLSEFNYLHGGRKFESGGSLDFTPQVVNPGGSGSSASIVVYAQAAFTDEQVTTMANEIAGKTSEKTQKAVVAGLDDFNRTAERELSLETSREI